jgi:hypothetical protein
MTRDEKTAILCMVTKNSFEYLQNCTKEEVDRLYSERVEKSNDKVQR